MQESHELSSGFLELNGMGQLLGGHQPFSFTMLVPLVEQEYIPVELCALFIHLHVPRLIWDTLS